MYYRSSKNYTKILTNVKKFLTNYDIYTTPVCLTNDNKIYKLSGTSTPTLNYTFASNVQNITDESSIFLSCFKYTESEIQVKKLYTIQYMDDITKAYTSNSALDSLEYEITSKTNDTIVVNGETYIRNGAEDLVFDFIPEDLENHTFSDVDLLQAYLDAGIRQGNE